MITPQSNVMIVDSKNSKVYERKNNSKFNKKQIFGQQQPPPYQYQQPLNAPPGSGQNTALVVAAIGAVFAGIVTVGKWWYGE